MTVLMGTLRLSGILYPQITQISNKNNRRNLWIQDLSDCGYFGCLLTGGLIILNNVFVKDVRLVSMFTLLKLELEKLFRARSFYLSFVVLIGFVVLMLWGFNTYAERKTGGEAVEQFKYTYESKQYFNGLTFALYSLLFSFTLLLPIFV